MKKFSEFLVEATDTEFVGIHYSNKPNLSHLHGAMYGTGIKGKESQRVFSSPDTRIRNRIYAYPKPSEGLPKPEQGLGNHAYELRSNAVLDTTIHSPNLESVKARAKTIHQTTGVDAGTAFESSVLDHGYEGYKTHQMAVLLKASHPVKYLGQISGDKSTFGQNHSSPSTMDKISPNSVGEVESNLLSPEHTQHWYKHKSEIQSVAPSARMQYGRMVAKKEDVANLQQHFKSAGLTI
jgi:hypothetical protein